MAVTSSARSSQLRECRALHVANVAGSSARASMGNAQLSSTLQHVDLYCASLVDVTVASYTQSVAICHLLTGSGYVRQYMMDR